VESTIRNIATTMRMAMSTLLVGADDGVSAAAVMDNCCIVVSYVSIDTGMPSRI